MVLTILTFWGIRVGEEQNKFKQSGVRSQESGETKSDLRPLTSEDFPVTSHQSQTTKSLSNTKTITNTNTSDLGYGDSGLIGDLSTQHSKLNIQNLNDVLYGKWIKRLYIAFLIFIAVQIIPLPNAFIKIISPKKIEVLNQLMDELPGFTSISWVPFETLIYGLIALLYGLFSLAFLRIQLKKREMVSLLNVLVLSACIQVVFGLLKLAQGNTHFYLFFYPLNKSDFSRFLTGTLRNANHFAFFLEMALPLALSLFFFRLQFFQTNIPWKQKILSIADENRIILVYFIGIALLGSGIFLTGSRAGIVTMAFIFILFTQLLFYLRMSQTIRRKVIWILIAIFGLVLYAGIQNTINEFKQSMIAEGGRFIRWPNTVKMAGDFPIAGTGMGAYRYSYFLYDEEPDKWSTHAHNDVLEVLAETGIPGGILFYSFLSLIILSLIRTWLRRSHPDVKILGLGIMVSAFAVIFHSVFDFSLRIPSNMFVLVLILVLGIKIVNYKKQI